MKPINISNLAMFKCKENFFIKMKHWTDEVNLKRYSAILGGTKNLQSYSGLEGIDNKTNRSSRLRIFRSSRLQMFYKVGVPKNFAKFTVKLLCRSLFFNKVASQTFFVEHLLWLLLAVILKSFSENRKENNCFRGHFSSKKPRCFMWNFQKSYSVEHLWSLS